MDTFSASGSSLFGTDDFAPVNPLVPESLFMPQPQVNQMPSNSSHLVVIDTGVQNYAQLASGILPGESLLLLDPQRDGLIQIGEALAQRQNVSSLYLVSHGGPGYIQLGNSKVDADALMGRSSEIRSWASSLTSDADILLYGCNVAAGESGLQFAQKLNTLTDADIAASNNVTGSQALGGDWILETNIGKIESSLPFESSAIADYQATLAPIRIQAEDYKAGGQGVGYNDLSSGNSGGAYRTDNVDIEQTTDAGGGYNVGWIEPGEWLAYNVSIPTTGTYNIVARVAADGNAAKSLAVSLGGQSVGTFNFNGTGGWQNWTDVTVAGVTLNAGTQELRLNMLSSLFNVNYIELIPVAPPAPDTTAPSATLTAAPLSAQLNSTSPYSFTVTYSDNVAVNVNSLDNLDILVTGPNQFSQTATRVSVSPNASGSPLAVTYQINPPGGTWDLTEAGQYTVALQNGQVTDTAGNAAIGGALGTFNVAVTNTPPSTTPIRIQAEDYKAGGQGVGYNDITAGNSGGAYRTDNVDIEGTTDAGGGYNVGWIDQGEWLAYNVSIPTTGTYNIVARVAADGNAAKSLAVSLGGQSVGTLNFNGTGGWQNWTDVTVAGVTLTAGTQELRLNMLSSLFNVNYIDLIPVGPPAPDISAPTATLNANTLNTPPNSTDQATLAPIRIQAEDYKAGGQGVGYNDLSGGNSGGAYRTDNVDIEGTTDTGGGYNVGWIDQGEWLAYNVAVPTTGTYNIVARVAADGNAAKSLAVSLGGQSVGTFNFNGTGGWQNWTDVAVAGVMLTAGTQELRLYMLSSSFNINYIDLIPVGSPTPSSAPSSNIATVPIANDLTAAAQTVPTLPPGLQNYNLVWSDEFNTPGISQPDPTKWAYEKGFVRNNESQYYTNGTNPDGSVRLDNASVSNGVLSITAIKEEYPNASYVKGSTDWKTKDPYAHYTSTSLTTRYNAGQVPSQPGYWQYGYIETRAKLPQGKGAWPAFWTLGYSLQQKVQIWPSSGEIDILEFVGKNPSSLYPNVWYSVNGVTKNSPSTFNVKTPDSLINDFHTYGIEWTPTSITWYFDGTSQATFNVLNADNANYNAFQMPHFLVLNYALGGSFGGPIDDSVLPQKFVVDYVRVFQH